MISNNINDATQECNGNPSCAMFYDLHGEGSKFWFCSDLSTEKPERDGSILYKKNNKGNLSTIRDLQCFRSQDNQLVLMQQYVFQKERRAFAKINGMIGPSWTAAQINTDVPIVPGKVDLGVMLSILNVTRLNVQKMGSLLDGFIVTQRQVLLSYYQPPSNILKRYVMYLITAHPWVS